MSSPEVYEPDVSATLISSPLPDTRPPTFFPSSFGQITTYFLSQVGDVQGETPLAKQKDHTRQATQAAKMARVVADFIGKAQKSIRIAIYDFLLTGEAEVVVLEAINKAARAGVVVQIAYNKRENEKTPAERGATGTDAAPLETEKKLTQKDYLDPHVKLKAVQEMNADPYQHTYDVDTLDEIAPPTQLEDIEHPSNIMHNKYIIRDGEAVLTGSANFTDGAWSLQENNVVIFEDAKELADYYEIDFNDLWTNDAIKGSGDNATGQVKVGDVPVGVSFAPGDGSDVTDAIVKTMNGAEKRVLVASMVISSQKILQAIHSLKQKIPDGVKVLIDRVEMNNAVLSHWRRSKNPASAEKLQFWEIVSEGFRGKRSELYVNGHNDWPHNFMHNKFVVADDIVVTGSFNFSQNAEKNAENIVIIQDKNIADAYAAYFEQIYLRYRN